MTTRESNRSEGPDLSRDLAILAEEDRERLGKAPNTEQLIAYRDGRLSQDEADRVRDRLAVDPELAALYLDVKRFPELETAGGEGPAADAEAAWQELTARLGDTTRSAGETSGEVVAFPRPAPVSRRLSGRRLLALAAMVILGLGFAWFAQLRNGPPSGSQEHVIVVTGATFRGPAVAVPPDTSVVVFQVNAANLELAGRYEIELVDAYLNRVRKESATVENREQEIELRVPTSSLRDGATYSLTVRPAGAAPDTPPVIEESLSFSFTSSAVPR